MSDERKMITWTIPMRERLRKAYQQAADKHLSSFVFEGHEFVTNYAKYLLEHLDNQLGPK